MSRGFLGVFLSFWFLFWGAAFASKAPESASSAASNAAKCRASMLVFSNAEYDRTAEIANGSALKITCKGGFGTQENEREFEVKCVNGAFDVSGKSCSMKCDTTQLDKMSGVFSVFDITNGSQAAIKNNLVSLGAKLRVACQAGHAVFETGESTFEPSCIGGQLVGVQACKEGVGYCKNSSLVSASQATGASIMFADGKTYVGESLGYSCPGGDTYKESDNPKCVEIGGKAQWQGKAQCFLGCFMNGQKVSIGYAKWECKIGDSTYYSAKDKEKQVLQFFKSYWRAPHPGDGPAPGVNVSYESFISMSTVEGVNAISSSGSNASAVPFTIRATIASCQFNVCASQGNEAIFFVSKEDVSWPIIKIDLTAPTSRWYENWYPQSTGTNTLASGVSRSPETCLEGDNRLPLRRSSGTGQVNISALAEGQALCDISNDCMFKTTPNARVYDTTKRNLILGQPDGNGKNYTVEGYTPDSNCIAVSIWGREDGWTSESRWLGGFRQFLPFMKDVTYSPTKPNINDDILYGSMYLKELP